ncbi:ATP-binding protein [Chryseolinea lacunae]|uniref:histidine kinase n=1 Tax=Chryseolinea lacunae TaxID=2801331 RepID=A0ABS1KYL6_9BACT|nr:ATP-binding protein [Chryseolinea lacunae]MBL0744543.1 hypothetical protein [Chryseolinea lacunae]
MIAFFSIAPGAKSQDRIVDSLSALIPWQHNLELTQTYLEMAFRHNNLSHVELALTYCAKADSMAESNGYEKENLRASILLARLYMLSEKLDLAEKKIQSALQKARKRDAVPQQLQALRVWGMIEERKNNHVKASMIMDEAIALARKANDHNNLLILLTTKGVYLYSNKQYDKFNAPMEEAVQLAGKYPTSSYSETLYGTYSQILLEMGDLERADLLNEKAFQYAKADGNMAHMRSYRSTSIIIYHALGKYPESIAAARETIRWARQLKDTTKVISSQLNLANVFRSMGHFRENFQLLDSTYALHHQMKEPSPQVEAYLLRHFAHLYSEVEDYPRSIQSLKQGLRLLDIPANGFEVNRSTFLRGIATAYKKLGQLDSAFFYNSVALREKLMPLYRETLLVQRSDLFLQADQIDSARVYMDQVHQALQLRNAAILKGFHPENAIAVVERSNYLVFDYYRVAGSLEKQRGHYDKAISFFETGLKLGDFWDAYSIEPLLYPCYQAVGRTEDALNSLQRYLLLKDSVTHSEMAYAQSEALARFRTLEKEHENAMLQLDKHQQTDTIERQKNIILFGVGGIALLALSTGIAFYNYRQKQAANVVLKQQHDEIVLQKQKTDDAFQELKETESQLIHAEKMAGLGQLIAGIAHEINNPLNFVVNGAEGIKSNLEAVRNGDDSHETLAEVELLSNTIRTGSLRMRAIVESLLKISHDNTETIGNVNLVENIELALVLIQTSVKTRDVKIAVHVEGSPIILGNSGEINQAMVNLLTNAVQAIPDAGRVDISVTEYGDESTTEIIVRDTGTGIAPHHLPKIFDPFFTTKAVGQGTGLGLPITMKIIQKHGGTLTVRTGVGEGTEFVIRLPRGY